MEAVRFHTAGGCDYYGILVESTSVAEGITIYKITHRESCSQPVTREPVGGWVERVRVCYHGEPLNGFVAAIMPVKHDTVFGLPYLFDVSLAEKVAKNNDFVAIAAIFTEAVRTEDFNNAFTRLEGRKLSDIAFTIGKWERLPDKVKENEDGEKVFAHFKYEVRLDAVYAVNSRMECPVKNTVYGTHEFEIEGPKNEGCNDA